MPPKVSLPMKYGAFVRKSFELGGTNMAKRRALKDTVKDPVVKKETVVKPHQNQAPNNQNVAFKIVLSLLLGFAGGLLTGRFIKI
jgi:hypothetical protein